MGIKDKVTVAVAGLAMAANVEAKDIPQTTLDYDSDKAKAKEIKMDEASSTSEKSASALAWEDALSGNKDADINFEKNRKGIQSNVSVNGQDISNLTYDTRHNSLTAQLINEDGAPHTLVIDENSVTTVIEAVINQPSTGPDSYLDNDNIIRERETIKYARDGYFEETVEIKQDGSYHVSSEEYSRLSYSESGELGGGGIVKETNIDYNSRGRPQKEGDEFDNEVTYRDEDGNIVTASDFENDRKKHLEESSAIYDAEYGHNAELLQDMKNTVKGIGNVKVQTKSNLAVAMTQSKQKEQPAPTPEPQVQESPVQEQPAPIAQATPVQEQPAPIAKEAPAPAPKPKTQTPPAPSPKPQNQEAQDQPIMDFGLGSFKPEPVVMQADSTRVASPDYVEPIEMASSTDFNQMNKAQKREFIQQKRGLGGNSNSVKSEGKEQTNSADIALLAANMAKNSKDK